MDHLVPWLVCSCTPVRTAVLCLLTKYADTQEGLAAFKRVSRARLASAGLFSSSQGGWVRAWVALADHPSEELRRIASESLRAFFNRCVHCTTPDMHWGGDGVLMLVLVLVLWCCGVGIGVVSSFIFCVVP